MREPLDQWEQVITTIWQAVLAQREPRLNQPEKDITEFIKEVGPVDVNTIRNHMLGALEGVSDGHMPDTVGARYRVLRLALYGMQRDGVPVGNIEAVAKKIAGIQR